MTYKLPEDIKRGRERVFDISTLLANYEIFKKEGPRAKGDRYVLGYPLPTWQRGLKWSETAIVSRSARTCSN